MKQISFIARRIWCGWFFLSGFLSFLPMYPFFLIFLSREKWFIYAFRLKKIWGNWMVYSSGVHYEVSYESILDKNQAYVICPNHSSYLDIILTNVCFPHYFHFMGKAELLDVPLFNIFFRKMNIAVNRSSITDSHKAFKRASTDLDKGISIAIYPEATIPQSSPKLGPFKNGAFRLAIEKQVPIVPVTFLDNWYLFPDKIGERFVFRPGLSRIIIHAPISTKGMTDNDLPALRKQVFDLIEKTILEKGRLERQN